MTSKPEDPRIAKLRELRDRACACKDKRCADAAQQDATAFAYADKTEGTSSDADAKAADDILRAFTDCIVAAGGTL